jgi:hypothetical protein
MQKELQIVKELVYDKCNFGFTNWEPHFESTKYAACSFTLQDKLIEYRVSKITSTKIGQFVIIWKRNKKGITTPFDIQDDLDFIIITSKSGHHLGQFIFPKEVLANQGIISANGKEGKRGIRVYRIWDVANKKLKVGK